MRNLKLFFFILFLIYPTFLHSHVNHYSNFELIEMDVLRNGKKIGYNKYIFKTQKDKLIVKNEVKFVTKFMGLSLLNIDGSSTEIYKNGKLIQFRSNTIQNKKKKYNSLKFDHDKNVYRVNGSSFNGTMPSNTLVGNWWNHSILQSEMIISPLSGSLKFQEVYFLSKETLKIKNGEYITSKFKIIMKKNIDDKKKEEFNIWLDDKSKIILKVSYSKFGDWEYIVTNVKKFY